VKLSTKTQLSAFSSETPTLSGKVYTLTKPEHLAWLSAQVMAGTPFSGYTMQMANDIDLMLVPVNSIGGLDTVAIRMPSHPVARDLISKAGVPIAAPSANLSGHPSPILAAHFEEDLNGRIDMIIDGGEGSIGLESTIVKINPDNTLTLLRPGKITIGELMSIAEVYVADAVTNKLLDGEKAISPGMKYKHYAPKAPLYLLDGGEEDAIKHIAEKNEGRVALICYSEDIPSFRKQFPDYDIYEFGSRSDEIRQAYLLFSILRDTDKKSYNAIYAPLPEQSGVGLALYNRMIRAAAHQIIRLGR
jgi:L-threonylcarbamoyladenylate synthase